MKLALVGYGKMGRAVEHMAMERGHEVVARIDPTLDTKDIRAETLGGADVAIEFTVPAAAVDNIRALAAAGVDAVVGTTGWHQRLDEAAEAVVGAGTGMVHASNFSLGVSLFLRLARTAAKMADALDEYDFHIREVHHRQKIDHRRSRLLRYRRPCRSPRTKPDDWRPIPSVPDTGPSARACAARAQFGGRFWS